MGSLVRVGIVAVYVRERHGVNLIGRVLNFIIPGVVGATNGRRKHIFYSVDVVNAFASKLGGKSIGEVVNFGVAVAVYVKVGNVFNLGDNEFAISALAINDVVTRSNDNVFSTITVDALVSTSALFGAGRSYNGGNEVAVGVAESCCELNVTYGTGLCSFASCCSAGGVAESCYVLRSLKNFVTNGALLAGSLTSFSTGCCNCFNCNFGVTERRNYFLVYDGFTALRASLTFGKTGLCAGGVLTGNNFLGMNVGGGGRFRCGRFSGFLRSGLCRLLVKQVTGSDRKHHSNGKYQSQNAKNVLVFHLENLHLKFGVELHGNIIS